MNSKKIVKFKKDHEFKKYSQNSEKNGDLKNNWKEQEGNIKEKKKKENPKTG